jgi:diguanylate cyclase (GGDEF)-like protein
MKAKLLVVEDDEIQGSALRNSLEAAGFSVVWVQSGFEALKIARSESPDVIILDVIMTGMDGLAVCRWLKMTHATQDIPIIMLTARGEVHDRVEGLNVGANDYMSKPCAPEELEARILAALRVREAQAELRERNQQLEAMVHRVEALAITDPLTGLYNRRRFSDVLRREFALTRRYQNSLSCLMLDIDHFKEHNDKHGHDFGDRVLKDLASLLSQNIREVDVACRYGGEEFVLLLPHTPKDKAMIVAERIVHRVRKLRLEIKEEQVAITISVGISSTGDVKAADPEALVRAADGALYEAKRQGRDRIVLYSVELDQL